MQGLKAVPAERPGATRDTAKAQKNIELLLIEGPQLRALGEERTVRKTQFGSGTSGIQRGELK